MKKTTVILMLSLALWVGGGEAMGEGEVVTVTLDFSDPNTFVTLIRDALEKAETTEKQGGAIHGLTSSLDNWVGELIKDEVVALSAKECQILVKKRIGAEHYERLETLLLRQLHTSNASLPNKKAAITALGYPLFSMDAIGPVKEFAFHQHKITQLEAILSLTYLEVPGAGTILNNMLLSGTLNDYFSSRAVKALYYSRERDLGNTAITLLGKKPGGSTFKGLVPILKERTGWPQLLLTLFKSDMYHVEKKENMSTGEKYLILAEKELLDEIGLDPQRYLTDPEVKAKILRYASNSTGKEPDLLRIKSLLILEKTGQELEYFTKMMNDENLPENTKMALEYIIARIKNGQRLQ